MSNSLSPNLPEFISTNLDYSLVKVAVDTEKQKKQELQEMQRKNRE
jgi:hypothetical protein